MVVIAIIGILAAVVLVNICGSTAKARDARRIADVKALADAFHLYYLEHGKFPSASTNEVIGDGSGVADTALANYMSAVPEDPLSGTSGYYYNYGSVIVCPNKPGNQAAIWVTTMEDASKANGIDVCGYANWDDVYAIVLGPANS